MKPYHDQFFYAAVLGGSIVVLALMAIAIFSLQP